jgi:hypothetical protein
VDAGFVSDACEAASAAETLRVADGELIAVFLVIDLQPAEAMDHASFENGRRLAYCGQCPVPEVANVFRRADIPFRSVSGYLRQDSAWARIGPWVQAATVRATLRTARHGLMSHLYPGMIGVSTDLTRVSTTFGSHVEVLEFDDLQSASMRSPTPRSPTDGPGPGSCSPSTPRSTRTTSPGPQRPPSAWTASWTTTASTRSPTTTAASPANSTNASAPP